MVAASSAVLSAGRRNTPSHSVAMHCCATCSAVYSPPGWYQRPIQLSAPAQESTSADGEVQEPAAPAAEPTPPAEMPAGAASAEQTAPAAPQASASAAEPAATADGDLLVFTANAETWLTVRDAQGKQLINRTLTSGETVKLTGEVPLSATVGRKDAVSVKVRGEPFDIKALSKTTVARFQVK